MYFYIVFFIIIKNYLYKYFKVILYQMFCAVSAYGFVFFLEGLSPCSVSTFGADVCPI